MEVIKSSTDISLVFKKGKRLGRGSTRLIALQHDEQHDLPGRVAFIAGKKNGNAVWRNRAKRRMRAACREIGGPWDGYDVLFIANRGPVSSDFRDLVSGYRKALEQMSL